MMRAGLHAAVAAEEGGEEHPARLVELDADGATLLLDRRSPAGPILRLRLFTGDGRRCAELICRVVFREARRVRLRHEAVELRHLEDLRDLIAAPTRWHWGGGERPHVDQQTPPIAPERAHRATRAA